MRKSIFSLAIAIIISCTSYAQLKVAFLGGAHQSTVDEKNNVPGWDTLKNNYQARTGAHFGVLADLPLGKHLSFQPGVTYFNKGRKFQQDFDPASSPNHIIRKTATQYINYVDVPFNLVLKMGNDKFKFIIGGGPYGSFFYTGKESSETITQTGISESSNYDDVPVGSKPGQYKVFNYGVNGLAGFEMGHVFLTANYSLGLNDFYQAVNYTGTFRHQVLGATLGVFLGKPVDKAKKEKAIADKDKDGIPDDKDGCPDEAGSALTNGCPDKDGDGIPDKVDKCPELAGVASYNGCPISDKDNDGVNDNDDKCPLVAGLKKYNGCPAPDADKDGIPDDLDKCPNVAGFARYNGCPVPDTDGDGVNDEEDKCPAVKGTKENGGCPAAAATIVAPKIKKEIVEKVNFAARRIQFKFTKTDLLPASYKVLDDVVKILTENPEIKVSIEGHTSNDGIPEANMKLSQARANTVKAYLQSKGIAALRLSAKGFGSTKLLNAAKTEAEKAENRRVELKLSN